MPIWLSRPVAAVARLWLTLRYQVLDQRYGRLVLEEVDGVPLIVLPQVFNPVLLRSGAFLARNLATLPWSAAVGRRLTVLDMGTGSGIGAIFAARRGAQVTAVDINPEAVRCARLNALLNQLEDRITIYQGDLFAPVAGQQFDLVLFNPPFYRGRPRDLLDHAWRGVDVFERFSQGLSQVLRPDGRAWLVLSSDGDGDQLLAALRAQGYTIVVVAQKNLVNEVLTMYDVMRHA
ncbi:MAG: HemK2/MTQ2 family protein methyltransferase [Chloroflexota bacterium]